MSNPVTFINDYSNNIVQLVRVLKALETQNAQMAADDSLISRYFTSASHQQLRADLDLDAVANARNSINQLLLMFNSAGVAPSLYKMLP